MMRDRVKSKLTNNWYFVKNVNGDYYTPFTTTKTKYFYSGDGSTPPTPKEIVDIINDKDKKFYEGAKCFYDVSNESGREPVELPSGVYLYNPEDHYGGKPERLTQFDLRSDKIFPFTETWKDLEKSVVEFLNNKEVYKKHELSYKRGYLLYGSPGGSKTIAIRHLIKNWIPKDSVTIFCNSNLPELPFILKVGETLKDTLKVFIFEELAASSTEWNIETLLNFLDGEYSIDNMIVLATTNYPQKLAQNIVNRPSRFDKLYNFDYITQNEIKGFISFLLDREPDEKEVVACKELTPAAIKDACLVTLMKKITLLEAIKEQKDRISLCKKAFDKPVQIGFNSGNDFY